MAATAKLFMNGSSQAARLPAEFRFEGTEIFIRRDPESGDMVLSRRPPSWESFEAVLNTTDAPADFMTPEDRRQGAQGHDPFAEADD